MKIREPTIEQIAAGFGEHGRKALEWTRHARSCPTCSKVARTRLPAGLCPAGRGLRRVYAESFNAICRERGLDESWELPLESAEGESDGMGAAG